MHSQGYASRYGLGRVHLLNPPQPVSDDTNNQQRHGRGNLGHRHFIDNNFLEIIVMDINIYAMTPANRTAAIVTSQTGCTVELTRDQRLENLRTKVTHLQRVIANMPKDHPKRKAVGIQISKINRQINKLRTAPRYRDVHRYIVDIVKERYTGFEWKRLVDEAVKRKATAEGAIS